MILLGKILLILCLMAATEGWNTHLQRQRRCDYYLQHELEHALDTWKEEEMKKPIE